MRKQTQKISIRLEPELLEKLNKQAQLNHETLSMFVRKCLFKMVEVLQ